MKSHDQRVLCAAITPKQAEALRHEAFDRFMCVPRHEANRRERYQSELDAISKMEVPHAA